MKRTVALILKMLTILILPIAVVSLVISRKSVTGNEYAAVVEILGTGNKPGALQIFSADTQTVSNILDWMDTWSLALLVAVIALALTAFLLSKDRIRACRQLSLGLFFSFGISFLAINKSNDVFISAISDSVSDISAIVMATYLAALSNSLLNLIGGLALFFALTALAMWLVGSRRTVPRNLTGN